ncbi:hypothetical protein BDY21DRAFT_283526 [Lineolata rhizophorae]|uniref:Uncharacterized protein n=1 Tax=Lineolata rhizophorae TaxID=578093 RepID=A0A6A6P4B0_9PEZI|nr:hypothetical protein BDY21DRAFT_283526 [Lineolata rhizophorae]
MDYEIKQSEANSFEARIFKEKASKFRGKARIMLEILHYAPESMREISRVNVGRLKDTFEKDGCYRLPPERHIPALIDISDLTRAIEYTGHKDVSLDVLLDNPKELPPLLKFPPSTYIECLRGKHRIQAAKECQTLKPPDKWWIVDLYLKDLNANAKRELIEEYSNSVNFSDGKVYSKITEYKSLNDKFAEHQWWARLSKSKRDILKRFLKHDLFATAFASLSTIPALFIHGFKIGTLHKMIGEKIDEEAKHYIDHILHTWGKILGEDRRLMTLTDPETIERLQLRVPGVSKNDLTILTQLTREGRIFQDVKDDIQRERILKNLSTISYPVPTIYTFRKDLKYIRPCARIMRQLLIKPGRRSKYTIRQAAEHAFSGVNQTDGCFIVQAPDSSLISFPGSLTDQIEFGYRQIYIYAMRYILDMVPERARKEDGHATPQPRKPSPRLWNDIANLAYRLGFESLEINRLRLLNPDYEIARDALLTARQPGRFEYDDFESLIAKTAEIFQAAREKSNPARKHSYVVDGPGEDIPRRCGWLFEKCYEYDQNFIFLEFLDRPSMDTGGGITSLFVRKSVYNAFFGTSDINSLREEPITSQLVHSSPDRTRRYPVPAESGKRIILSQQPPEVGGGSPAGIKTNLDVVGRSSTGTKRNLGLRNAIRQSQQFRDRRNMDPLFQYPAPQFIAPEPVVQSSLLAEQPTAQNAGLIKVL